MLIENFEYAYEGWHLYKGFYGDVNSVEVVLNLEEDNFYLGVGININFEGSYQLRMTDKSYEATGKYHLSLNKRTATLSTLKSLPFIPSEFDVSKGKSVKLRLECIDGYLRGYLNDQFLIEYDDSSAKRCFLTGWCGVWICPMKAATIQEIHCNGTEKTPPDERQVMSKSNLFYKMNLEDADENEKPPFWSSAPFDISWAVRKENDKKAYTSPLGAKRSLTHLYLFEKDPIVRMHMSAKLLQQNGRFGVLLRHAPDTAYLRVGYQNQRKRWFIEDTPAQYDCQTQLFQSEIYEWDETKSYEIELEACEDTVFLFVDQELVLKATHLRHIGFGRIGLWTEQADMQVFDFYADTPYATEPVDGVIKTFVDRDHFAASSELEVAPDNSLIAVTKVFEQDADKEYHTGIYRSNDEGLSFQRILQGEDYSGLETYGCYQSILKLHDGTYLQVLLGKKLLVQKSTDLIHWESLGNIVSVEEQENQRIIFHTSSMVEYKNMEGQSRIFIPLVFANVLIDENTKLKTIVHNTVVYYSDDQGVSWTSSDVSTSQILEDAGCSEMLSYAECKICQCADGSLRLYNSRNDTHFMCYSESYDFGRTWKGLYTIRELQCPKSSCAICEDPYEPGTHYLAWVNDKPVSRGNGSNRTRLSLARSYDGKQWHYLCDAERMCLRYADEMPYTVIPLFQIVDPSITVTRDYVYLSYGISMFGDKNAKQGELKAFHHEQRPALVRFEKKKLLDQPWDVSNICDMSLLDTNEEEM